MPVVPARANTAEGISSGTDVILFEKNIWKKQLTDALKYWLFLPAAVLVPGLFADRLLDLAPLPLPRPRRLAALLLVAAGCLLIAGAIRDLKRYGQGTPNPCRPPKKLVTAGVYRFCRHPMWLGYDLAAVGIVLALGSPVTLAVCLPLFFLWQIRFLKREEHILAMKFAPSFARYCRHTPLLVPRPGGRRQKDSQS